MSYWDLLPSACLRLIYEFDSTYHNRHKAIMSEMFILNGGIEFQKLLCRRTNKKYKNYNSQCECYQCKPCGTKLMNQKNWHLQTYEVIEYLCKEFNPIQIKNWQNLPIFDRQQYFQIPVRQRRNHPFRWFKNNNRYKRETIKANLVNNLDDIHEEIKIKLNYLCHKMIYSFNTLSYFIVNIRPFPNLLEYFNYLTPIIQNEHDIDTMMRDREERTRINSDIKHYKELINPSFINEKYCYLFRSVEYYYKLFYIINYSGGISSRMLRVLYEKSKTNIDMFLEKMIERKKYNIVEHLPGILLDNWF